MELLMTVAKARRYKDLIFGSGWMTVIDRVYSSDEQVLPRWVFGICAGRTASVRFLGFICHDLRSLGLAESHDSRCYTVKSVQLVSVI